MFNFDLLEKGLGIFSPAHFVYGLSRKMFLCYNLLTDQISLPDCLYLVNVFIGYVCKPSCSDINFEIKLVFLIKPHFYMAKKSRQILKYLKNEKIFSGKIKGIFNNFKLLLVAQNFLRLESAPLKEKTLNLSNNVH